MKLTQYKPKAKFNIMYSRANSSDMPFNYEPLRGEVVVLEEVDFAQAQQISQRWQPPSSNVQVGSMHPDLILQRWSIYLHALALKAFECWFSQRTTPVSLDVSQAAILLPDRLDIQPVNIKNQISVCQIHIDGFKICLVVTDGSSDNWQIPRSTVQNPRFASHFYIPIVIHEELGQAEILGFLRHNQLPEIVEGESNCRLTIAQANSDLEELLLYLSCLEPIAIPLPEAVSTLQERSQRLRQLLLQPVVQTRQWLTQQVGVLSEQLGTAIVTELAAWQVLPQIELATAVRSGLRDVEMDSPLGDLSAILMSLMRGGMQMPLEKATAYQDLQLGDLALRLYVVTAMQATTPEQNPSEWSLLVILRSQDRTDLPQGVEVQIADANAVLVDRQTDTNHSDFLYATAIGDMGEEFTVTLGYQDQTIMLPPFTFE